MTAEMRDRGDTADEDDDAEPEVDDRVLWGYIGLPALGAATTIVWGPGAPVLGSALVIGVTVAFVLADLTSNPSIEDGASTKRAGFVLAGVLVGPLYVWLRQRSLNASRWPVALSLAVGIAAAGLMFVMGMLSPIDGGLLEDELERWAAAELEVSVAADCPDAVPARPGYRFVCELDGTATLRARVEVLDRAGRVRWETRAADLTATPTQVNSDDAQPRTV